MAKPDKISARKRRRSRLVERLGLHWLRLLDRRTPPRGDKAISHVLDDEERKTVDRIVRSTIRRAFVIGAIAAALIAGGQIALGPLFGLGEDIDHRPLMALLEGEWHDAAAQVLGYYLAMIVLCVLLGMAEIVVLQLDALRAIHALSRVVGMRIFGDNGDSEREEVAEALARAAMELPDPPEVICGIDPRAEMSRWRLLITSAIYKAKIGVSNFLLKALVRRLLGRAALRSLVTFIAVPVTGAWAAWVCHRVMREARSRVLGPSAVHEVIDALLATCPEPDAEQQVDIFRAIGAVIQRRCDMHPNHALLLMELHRRLPQATLSGDITSRQLLHSLSNDDDAHRALSLRAMGCAIAVDGQLTMAERSLLRRALQACGRPADLAPYRALAQAFVAGEAIPASLIWHCWPDQHVQVYTDRWHRRRGTG